MRATFDAQILARYLKVVEGVANAREGGQGAPFISINCVTSESDAPEVVITSSNDVMNLTAKIVADDVAEGEILLSTGILSSVAAGTKDDVVSVDSNGSIATVVAGRDTFLLPQLSPDAVTLYNVEQGDADSTVEFDADEFAVVCDVARKFTPEDSQANQNHAGVNFQLGATVEVYAASSSRAAMLSMDTHSFTGEAGTSVTLLQSSLERMVDLVKVATADMEEDEAMPGFLQILNGERLARFLVGDFTLESTVQAAEYPRSQVASLFPDDVPEDAGVFEKSALTNALRLATCCADETVTFERGDGGGIVIIGQDHEGNVANVHVDLKKGSTNGMTKTYNLKNLATSVRSIRADEEVVLYPVAGPKGTLFVAGANDHAAFQGILAPYRDK